MVPASGGIHFHSPSAPQSLHQIPEPTCTFKGRQEELDELTEAIREGNVALSREVRASDGPRHPRFTPLP